MLQVAPNPEQPVSGRVFREGQALFVLLLQLPPTWQLFPALYYMRFPFIKYLIIWAPGNKIDEVARNYSLQPIAPKQLGSNAQESSSQGGD